MTPRRLLLLLLSALLTATVPSGLALAQDESIQNEEAKPAPKSSKKKPAKKKTYDYEKSKYKSMEPSQTPHYKFDERGEAISAEKKKAAVKKKKKRSEPPEVGSQEGAEACGSEDVCAEKKTEADAL
jgi:hypothetical protein